MDEAAKRAAVAAQGLDLLERSSSAAAHDPWLRMFDTKGGVRFWLWLGCSCCCFSWCLLLVDGSLIVVTGVMVRSSGLWEGTGAGKGVCVCVREWGVEGALRCGV